MPTVLLGLLLSGAVDVEIHVEHDVHGVPMYGDAASMHADAEVVPLKLTPRIGTRAPAPYHRRQRVTRKKHRSRHQYKTVDQREQACFQAKEHLTQIENKRRHGYTVKQDQPLRDAWEKYNQRRRFYCR